MRSMPRFDILENIVDSLFEVARHLGVSGGFVIQARELMRLEQVIQRKCRTTRTQDGVRDDI